MEISFYILLFVFIWIFIMIIKKQKQENFDPSYYIGKYYLIPKRYRKYPNVNNIWDSYWKKQVRLQQPTKTQQKTSSAKCSHWCTRQHGNCMKYYRNDRNASRKCYGRMQACERSCKI
jgi:hypothetical protein